MYGAETSTLWWKAVQKYLGSCEMSCWRRIEQIRWKDHVKNEKVLHTVMEEMNILHTLNRRKANWIGHILHKNCLLQHGTVDGKDEEEDKSSH